MAWGRFPGSVWGCLWRFAGLAGSASARVASEFAREVGRASMISMEILRYFDHLHGSPKIWIFWDSQIWGSSSGYEMLQDIKHVAMDCPAILPKQVVFFFVWGNKLAGRKCTHLCLEAHDILRGFWKKGLNMSKLLETWYGCSQSNFAPCAPLVTAYLLADLILLINNNQQSLSGLLTEVCAFVKFGRLSLEQHLDGELWQAWKWERLRKMGRSVCSVLLVFNWFTRWVPVGVLWSMFTVWFGDKITCM
jgi:hypothetical protein